MVLIERAIAATDAAIAAFFSDFKKILEYGPARERAFAIELVAREAVQNAVEYGCLRDAEKRAHVVAAIEAGVLSLRVDDEGTGFDPEAILAYERARGSGTSGNGVSIISVYSDRYRYENGGRTLIVEFVIGEEEIMQDVKKQGCWTPMGDIVAANAQAAKEELRSLVGSSSGDFVVDLSSVRMIDSKGLGIIIATVNSLEPLGRNLLIRGANEDLAGLFKMMRLDRHLRLERDAR